jgi:uncharacterized membrane protein YkvA (DUF1232 family)
MTDHGADFYQKLRVRMREWQQTGGGATHPWIEFLMWGPDLFHLLCKLSLDRDVPVGEKAKLAGAIAYFLSPVDLIPELVLGPAGYVDDIAVAAFVLNAMLNRIDPVLITKHWAGDEDLLKVIQAILGVADRMVGSGLWAKLRRRF